MYEQRLYVKHHSEIKSVDRTQNFFEPHTITLECHGQYWTISRKDDETLYPGYTKAVYTYTSQQPDVILCAKDLPDHFTKKKGHQQLLARLQEDGIKHCLEGDTEEFDFYDYYFESAGTVSISDVQLITIPNKKSLEGTTHSVNTAFDTTVLLQSSDKSVILTNASIDTDVIKIHAAKKIVLNNCQLILNNMYINGFQVNKGVFDFLKSKGITIKPLPFDQPPRIILECKGSVTLDCFELRSAMSPDIDRHEALDLKQKLSEVTGCTWRYSKTCKVFWCIGTKPQINSARASLEQYDINLVKAKEVETSNQLKEPQYCLRLSSEQALQFNAQTQTRVMSMRQ